MTLIQHHIIPIGEFEAQLAKFVVRDFKPSVIDFVSNFIRQALTEQPPLAAREQLARTIEALAQAARSDRATEMSSKLLEDLRLSSGSNAAANRAEAESQEIKEQLTFFFSRWVRIFQQSSSLEKSFVEYVVQLQDEGILKGEDLSSRFFRSRLC